MTDQEQHKMQKYQEIVTKGRLPTITVAEEDLEALSDIAESLLGVMPDVGHFLDRELSRAQLRPLRLITNRVVVMGSLVEFTRGAEARIERLKLVYPADHVADGTCVSIASPVGVALLGLKEGQSISWEDRRGKMMTLTVAKIHPPESTR
jgi:regulator of nucleoside diphosphate kinase